MEDITDADYTETKRICKDFEIKDLGEYQDLYVESDILLSAVYLRTLEICVLYKLDPAKFLSGPGLAWQAALK